MNAQKQFVEWVKHNDPFLYQVALERYKLTQQMGGFADFFSQLTNTVKEVAPTLINLQSQKKILDVQVKRAEQNLPPLDTTQYSPVIRVAPEITPATEQAAKNIAVESLKGGFKSLAMPLMIGGGLLAFLMLRRR